MYSGKFFLLLGVLLGVAYYGAHAQCGPEDITVTDWCENTYAKWEFDHPTPNASYTWYNYNGETYTAADLDANGHIIKAGSIRLDSLTTPEFYSPFRVREADLADPAAGISYTYVKRVRYQAVNQPTTPPAFSNGTGTFGMSFSLSESIRLNSVKVPVILNTPGRQYKIQVMAGSTGSAVYSFSTLSATHISGNYYMIEVPVNFNVASGNQTLTINTNPTGGSGVSVDGLLYAAQQPPAQTVGPLAIALGAANISGSNYSVIYDWDFTVTCAPVNTPAAMKQTAGCCVPPASLDLLSFNTDKHAIVHNGADNANLIVGSGDPANYFAWYLNGILVPDASGTGKMTYATNQTGTWEVREVRSQANLDNPSCYASRSLVLHERQIFASIVSAPSTSPLCIGDQWVLSGTGSNNLSWTTARGSLSPATGNTTTYMATEVGSATITLTGDVVTGNLILNGDFENSALDQAVSTQMPYASNPTGSDGVYTITADALNNGAWSNTDWSLNNNRPTTKGNPGRFMLINGTDNATAKPLIWGQNVSVTPGKEYVFSFDLASVSYIVSNNMTDYNATPTAPWRDVVLEIYINGVSQGTASTDFGANGGLDAVGKWMNHAFPWTAGSTETQATLEIRQITPANEPRGYDYGLDNIAFGGYSTQTDEISIGPITDCSSITASASACIDDTLSELTATLTGGLVFDRWENEAGQVVGNDNPLRVKSTVAETYTGYAFLVAGNVLDNGDFESGNVGFISGSPQYYSYVTSMPAGANNSYVVSNQTNAGNGAWLNLVPPVGGTRMFSADAKGPVGQKIIAWTFEADAGDQFLFSGWAANQHIDYQNNPNNSTPTGWIGVSITGGTPNSATDPLLVDFELPKNNLWHQRSAIWTAPSTGTFTLYLQDLRGSNGGGNDFALDDFSLSPLTGIVKTAIATTPVCNPCLGIAPELASANVCAGLACFTIDTTGSTALDNTAFDWYASETGGARLSAPAGQNPFCIDVSNLTKSGSDYQIWVEDKRIYEGMVGAKPSCTYNYDNVDKYHQEIVVYRDITLSELKFMAKGHSIGNKTTRLQVYTHDPSRNSNNGGPSNTLYREDNVGVSYTIANQNVPIEVTYSLPANFTLAGSPEGTRYWIRLAGGDQVGVMQNCGGLPVTDNVPDEQIIDLRRTTDYGNNPTSNNFGTTYDIKFNYKSRFNCGRFPLTVSDDESCPCAPPVSVDINPAFDMDTILCAGTDLTLSAAYTLDAAPLNGYTYIWLKKNATGLDTLQGPTSLSATPVSGTLEYDITTIAASDAGQYILRIEDGSAGSGACSIEDTLELIVSLPVGAGTIGSDTTICSGSVPSPLEGVSLPTGGTGTYFYQWERSEDGGSTWSAISGATGEDYTLGALIATTSYRRLDSSGVCPSVATNEVVITVTDPVVAGTIGNAQTICSGSVPAPLEGVSLATGGTGTYVYQWERSVDAGSTWEAISGATAEGYAPGALTATTSYRRIDSSGVCSNVATNSVTITVWPVVVAGSITGEATVCSGNALPAPISELAAPGGGDGIYTYQWQYSTDGLTGWTSIPGATSASYNPPSSELTATIYYRRMDASAMCEAQPTNIVEITVNAGISAGTIGGDQEICHNTIPLALDMLTPPTGITSSAVTTWEQSVDNGLNWTVIPGETNDNLVFNQPLTTSMLIRKRVLNSSLPLPCNVAVSPEVSIVTRPALVVGVISGDQEICEGQQPATLTGTGAAGGDGAYTYLWQSSVDGGVNWTNAIGINNDQTYAPATLMETTLFRRLDNDGLGCGPLNSNSVEVRVVPNLPVSVSINDPGEGCPGTSLTFIAAPLNEGSSPVYRWMVNGVDQSVSGSQFTSGALSHNDVVRVELVSSLLCKTGSPALSNDVVVKVTSAVTPEVSLNDPGRMCVGTSVTFTPVSNGGGNSTYEWFVNGQLVATSHHLAPSFTPSTLENGDEVYVVLTSSLPCATQPTAVSNKVVMRYADHPAPVIHQSDTTICEGDPLILTTTFNSGNGSLTWYQAGQAVAMNTDKLNVSVSGVFTVGINNGVCPEAYSDEVRVEVVKRPLADAGPDMYVKENDLVQLNAKGDGVSLWSPATGLSDPAILNPILTATNTITYTLTVSDPGERCFSTDEVTIIVEKPVIIPNVVTPNGDGLNDVWEIENMGGFPNATVKIYNRWGNIVWESHGYTERWGGTNRHGQLLPDGTYFYVIDLHSNVYSESITGYVQIIK